jgi:hypothetical protein
MNSRGLAAKFDPQVLAALEYGDDVRQSHFLTFCT